MTPRYPQLHVSLCSKNPFALVGAIRLAMRRSKIQSEEIERFTVEALSRTEPMEMRRVCANWASIGSHRR